MELDRRAAGATGPDVSHTGIIKVGRLVTADVLLNLDALRPETLLYQRGSSSAETSSDASKTTRS